MNAQQTPHAGKVAIVTGSARRMGLAMARRLAAQGAAVVLNGRSDRGALDEAVAALRTSGARAIGVLADVSGPEGAGALIGAAREEFGRVDILIHNAALRPRTPLEAITAQEWRTVVGTILDGAFFTAQAAAPELRRVRGSIIAIGGVSSFIGGAGHAHVVAAKAALIGLVRALAAELGPDGVRVNCVVPGTIEDEADDPALAASRRASRPVDRVPLRRMGRLEDVVEVVAALSGDGFGYVTGQAIHVNGGLYLG